MPVPKPPRPALNRRHPLARGLVFAMPSLNLIAPTDLVSEKNGARTGTSNSSGLGRAGSYLSSTNSNSYWDFGSCGALSDDPSWSVFFLADCTVTGTRQDICCRANTATSYRWEYQIVYDSAGKFAFARSDGTNTGWAETATTFSGLCSVLITVPKGKTGYKFYVNGVDATGSGGGTYPSTVTATTLHVGHYFEVGLQSYPFTSKLFDLRVWNRELPKEAAQDLYADPWALYTESKLRRQWQGWDIRPTTVDGATTKGREYTIRSRSRVKPALPVLNDKHPLARGLMAFTVFGRGQAAGSGYDLVTKQPISALGGAGADGKYGWSTRIGGSTTARVHRQDLSEAQIWPISFFTIFRYVSSGSGGYTRIFNLYPASGGGRHFSVYQMAATTNVWWDCALTAGQREQASAYSSAPSLRNANTWWVISGSVNINSSLVSLGSNVLSINGVSKLPSIGYSITTTVPSATPGLYMSGDAGGADTVDVVAQAWWGGRALSARDHATLYADPWALYAPERKWYAVDAVSASTFSPWLQRSRLVVR